MYLVKTPHIIQSFFPNFLWQVPGVEKRIYLTFDDGPIPEVTPWVVEQLSAYKAQATFFCVGNNVDRYPEVFDLLRQGGHGIGHHTYHHLNGWQTDNIPYFHDVRRAANAVGSNLFRPPYGRIKPKQAQFLQRHYNIVMWDVLSGDFDQKISSEQCLNNVVSNATSGSIVVFHDSLKAEEKLRFALPRVLEHFSALGYTFEALPARQVLRRPSLCGKRA